MIRIRFGESDQAWHARAREPSLPLPAFGNRGIFPSESNFHVHVVETEGILNEWMKQRSVADKRCSAKRLDSAGIRTLIQQEPLQTREREVAIGASKISEDRLQLPHVHAESDIVPAHSPIRPAA